MISFRENKPGSSILVTANLPGGTNLKLFTLLFDKVLFPYGDPIWEFYDLYGENEYYMMPVPKKIRRQLKKIWFVVRDIGVPFTIKGDYQQIEDNKMRKFLEREARRLFPDWTIEQEFDHTTIEDIADLTLRKIGFWRKKLPKSFYFGDPLDQTIFNYRLELREKSGTKYLSKISLNLDELTWQDILDLRKSEFISSFRNKFNDFIVSHNFQEFHHHYLEALEKLMDLVKPDLRNMKLELVLGNFPLGLINPISLYGSLRDMHKAKKLIDDYGWVFFLHEKPNLINPIAEEISLETAGVRRCQGFTKTHKRCKNHSKVGFNRCHVHLDNKRPDSNEKW